MNNYTDVYGFLKKVKSRRYGFGKTNKRWFEVVFSERKLRYRKDSGGMVCKEFDFRDIEDFDDDVPVYYKNYTRWEYGFQVEISGKDYTLFAETWEEYDLWCRAIKSIVGRRRKSNRKNVLFKRTPNMENSDSAIDDEGMLYTFDIKQEEKHEPEKLSDNFVNNHPEPYEENVEKDLEHENKKESNNDNTSLNIENNKILFAEEENKDSKKSDVIVHIEELDIHSKIEGSKEDDKSKLETSALQGNEQKISVVLVSCKDSKEESNENFSSNLINKNCENFEQNLPIPPDSEIPQIFLE